MRLDDRVRMTHMVEAADYDIVWQTATIEVPAMLPTLREILSTHDHGNS